MTWAEQPFGVRFHALGDEAERVFEQVWEGPWERYGLHRPRISLVRLPPIVRATPDYLTSTRWVEVVGCGKAQELRMKNSKIAALDEWHRIWEGELFVWDRFKRRWGTGDWGRVSQALTEHGTDGAFDQGRNPYKSLPLQDVPVEWKSFA